MKNNKMAKMGILVVVLLLAVAFAAVTANLEIGGKASVGANNDEFEKNVVFADGEYDDVDKTAYLLVGSEKKAVTLSADKKKIEFEAPKFTNTGDYAELHYWVENKSTNYAAELAAFDCTVEGPEDAETDYIKVTVGTAHDGAIVDMGQTTDDDNTVKVELSQTYVGDDTPTYKITCTIVATGVETSEPAV